MPSMPNLIPGYCDYLKQSDIAKTTFHSYTCHLRNFVRWLCLQAPLADVSYFELRTLRLFKAHLQQERKMRPRSVRTGLYALRSFGKFLMQEGHIVTNPAELVDMPKLDRARRELVSDEEAARVLAACDYHPDRPRLAKAVVMTLLYSGLRRQELVDLLLSDLDFKAGCIHVRHGKGDKFRDVYLHPDALAVLRAYVPETPDKWVAGMRPLACRHEYLFAIDVSRRMGHVSLRKLLNDVCALAGYRGCTNIKPHSLRHNYATRLLQNGADLQAICDSLGHSAIATTAIYLHSDPARLKEVAQYATLKSGKVPTLPPQPEPEREPALPPAPPTKRTAAWRKPATASTLRTRQDLRKR